jgi:hypothetical protein
MKARTKDILYTISILLWSFILIYYTPAAVAKIGMVPLLVLALFSKRNEIWVVILFIIIDKPGGFFSTGYADASSRLPLYKILPGMSFIFTDLLAIILIIKSLMKRRVSLFYQNQIYAFSFIIILAIFLTFSNTFSINIFVSYLREIILLSLIYFLPRLLNNEDSWNFFFIMIFPFVFLNFASQLYGFFNGVPLVAIVNPEYIETNLNFKAVIADSQEASRIFNGVLTGFISIAGVLYYLSIKRPSFKRSYLITVLVFSILPVFLAAYRSWSIAYSMMILLFLLFVNPSRRKIKYIPSIIVLFIFIFLFLRTSPLLNTQLNNALSRLSTIENLAQGDLTLGNTATRLTEKLEDVWNLFKANPMGYGFSQEGFNYNNEHVGWLSQIIQFGIIGYIVLYSSLILMNFKLLKLHRGSSRNNPMRGAIIVSLLMFLGIFMIQFGRQMFGVNRISEINMIIVFYFTFTNYISLSAMKNEYKFRSEFKRLTPTNNYKY